MKKPIVDTSAFEDLRSQKLCVTKIEYICVWAVWMAVLIFVGVQLWSEYSTPAGLALGRIVILGVITLGYISSKPVPFVHGCQKLAMLVEQSSKAKAYRDEVVSERELCVLDLYYAQFIAKDEIQNAWCQKAHGFLAH